MAARFPHEITLDGAGSPADWRLGLTNGRGKSSIDATCSRLVLEGAPGTRAVFRWSLPTGLAVHATLESNDHAVRVCQQPIGSLPPTGALETGPANDAHFGVGWHSAEDAATQHFRWSRRTSTLQWRMETPSDVRLILPLRAAHADGATIRATLNGVEIGTCALPKGAWAECRLTAAATQSRTGINELVLASDTVAPNDRPGDPRELAFVMQAGRVRLGK